MSYYVSEDLVNASGPRVHAESCGNYARRKPNATTMKWHGPFATSDAALAHAERIARGSNSAAVHSCVRPSAETSFTPGQGYPASPSGAPEAGAPAVGVSWFKAEDLWVPGSQRLSRHRANALGRATLSKGLRVRNHRGASLGWSWSSRSRPWLRAVSHGTWTISANRCS